MLEFWGLGIPLSSSSVNDTGTHTPEVRIAEVLNLHPEANIN